jgi:lactoylglutathione lyase
MKLDHITLLVASLDLSMPYYDELLPLLGFRKLRSHVWTDDQGFFFQFLKAKPNTSQYQRYGAGLNHLGFGASSANHVQAIGESMRSAGFDTPEIQDIEGAIALFMKDPDGIRFEITYYPPGKSVVD